ncbi:MAG: FAD-binding oxidoreductase [Bacteroidota bacterium]
MQENRSYWGWGYEHVAVPGKTLDKYKALIKGVFQMEDFEEINPQPVESLSLRSPRISLPPPLNTFCSSSKFDRASHSYGKAFRDVWRGLHGIFPNPPDYVAFPKSESDILQLMAYAASMQIALIPYGGGSSVCGGVEPTASSMYAGTISVDMRYFDQILEIDRRSRSAHIQGGMFGPAIEAALKPEGMTLRHYPQSFEFSTLGGWIATRSGGHYATLYTHIDEFVQNISLITPQGKIETRRLPGSGAGPSEERLFTGSEGILGIISSAWMRLQDIPTYKQTVTVAFPSFEEGVEGVRALGQSGLNPTNARLIDSVEAFNNGLGDGSSTVLIVGFESHQRSVDYLMEEALSLCGDCGGKWDKGWKDGSGRSNKADTWKNSFLMAPYLRDALLKLGMVVETFETAITWDQYPNFYTQVKKAAQHAIQQYCGMGLVTCRFTHIYPDGPAPYFTILAKGEKGKQLEQWDGIKQEVSEAIIKNGGTITHHHAVGKDHRPYYSQQHSPIFGDILKASKKTVDPNWILNPGVLIQE